MTTEDLQQIQNLVSGAKNVWVLTHKNPSVDVMASVLSLYLGLLKMGKNVTVAMESAPLVEVSNLVGIDQVRTSFSGKNMVLTYAPYQLGDIEQVSYAEDEGTNTAFKLTLVPREGLKLDSAKFSFSSTGASADLIFSIEVVQPTDLGALYDPAAFSKAQIINIDNHDENKDYGRFNLVEPNAATVSEITTFFLRAINVELDSDIANNLYQGLSHGSNNYQSAKVGAATFEAAAICLRAGAKPAQNTPIKGEIPVMGTKVEPKRETVNNSQPVQPSPTSTQPADGGMNLNPPRVYRGTSVI